MKSELTQEFITLFKKLPTRIQQSTRNNFKLWKKNPYHPGIEFKKLKSTESIYSVRVGIGWRALGVKTNSNTIVWFWIGNHNDYDRLISRL